MARGCGCRQVAAESLTLILVPRELEAWVIGPARLSLTHLLLSLVLPDLRR